MKSKILFVVEGAKDEVRILGSKTKGLLSLIDFDYEIVPFECSIYELYDAYKNNLYDDLVSYLRIEKGLKIDDDILSKDAFSAVYLIFDFEPHYHKYNDNKIKELLFIFNNETELGKLYINYPMVESYYHLLELPDEDYNDRVVSLDDFKGKNYKSEVNRVTCIKKNNIPKKELCYIIYHNYCKAKYLSRDNSKLINYDLILDTQIKKKNRDNQIYVLSLFPLILIDYNIDAVMEVIKLTLKEDFYLISDLS